MGVIDNVQISNKKHWEHLILNAEINFKALIIMIYLAKNGRLLEVLILMIKIMIF